MEAEQAEEALADNKFLDVHMYLTAALQRTDMRAVALHTAIEILHEKVIRYEYSHFVSTHLLGREIKKSLNLENTLYILTQS